MYRKASYITSEIFVSVDSNRKAVDVGII